MKQVDKIFNEKILNFLFQNEKLSKKEVYKKLVKELDKAYKIVNFI